MIMQILTWVCAIFVTLALYFGVVAYIKTWRITKHYLPEIHRKIGGKIPYETGLLYGYFLIVNYSLTVSYKNWSCYQKRWRDPKLGYNKLNAKELQLLRDFNKQTNYGIICMAIGLALFYGLGIYHSAPPM